MYCALHVDILMLHYLCSVESIPKHKHCYRRILRMNKVRMTLLRTVITMSSEEPGVHLGNIQTWRISLAYYHNSAVTN